MKKYIQQLTIEYQKRTPWTPVYGLVRSLLALGTFLTLVFNDNQSLFLSIERYLNHESVFSNTFLHQANLFLLFGVKLWIGKSIAILILVLVMSGWRPAFTGLLHFWVAISFSTLSGTIDGGDTITSILTFFLIPVCLTDNRKSHWVYKTVEYDPYVTLFVWSIFSVIRLQICIIYLHSGIDKLRIEEWTNGTCTYYWFTNNIYGVAEWFRPTMIKIMSLPVVVVVITWGTIIFEIFLGMAILMKRNQFNWKVLLLLGLLFHLGIVLIFGLVSFFMAMASCLILYLVPMDYIRSPKKQV